MNLLADLIGKAVVAFAVSGVIYFLGRDYWKQTKLRMAACFAIGVAVVIASAIFAKFSDQAP